MESNICLLGFTGSFLSLIFNTLRDLGNSKKLIILEYIESEDVTPFECGLPYERLWHDSYTIKEDDDLFFSMSKTVEKRTVFNFFTEKYNISRERFINIIHPSVHIAYKHQLGCGIYIEPGSIVSPYVQLGFGTTINRACSIGHHTFIEEFATLSPGVHIGGHSRIGAGVRIGIGTTIFDHVSIGAGSIIGGGSVVNKDIPAGVVAFGNPCKVVKSING